MLLFTEKVDSGKYQNILVFTKIFWYLPEYFGIYQNILVNTKIFWGGERHRLWPLANSGTGGAIEVRHGGKQSRVSRRVGPPTCVRGCSLYL